MLILENLAKSSTLYGKMKLPQTHPHYPLARPWGLMSEASYRMFLIHSEVPTFSDA